VANIHRSPNSTSTALQSKETKFCQHRNWRLLLTNMKATFTVPVNQCIVFQPRTECEGPDVDSSEGPLFDFIPERDRGYDDIIGLVPESSMCVNACRATAIEY